MSQDRAVAVVGIGCRFPGGADTHARLWSLVCGGGDAIGDIPPDRIDLKRFYDATPATPGKTVSRFGGYLDQIDRFDAAFFGISPRDAERMDPQHRLLMETAWEALEDAGIDAISLDGRPVGAFVGEWIADFESRLFGDPTRLDFPMTIGSGRYAASGRLSYALGLMGPSITVDTACSSSLAAVHLAVQSLRSQESELALAGGVNVILTPHIHVAYSQSRMLSADGRCKFGDASADGYVRSEGAGVLVLKRLREAIADGDRVHAVILGSAVNHDGRSSGSMGRPSRTGQAALLRRACEDAGIAPERITYVEAHGTGTRAGDPVEIGAIADVIGTDRSAERPVYVGSVKTNIGHCEGAAGVAGAIKAALCVREGLIPPSLHLKTPSELVRWDEAPLEVPRQLTAWPEARRVAAASSYGIGGTNAHVILEAAPAEMLQQEEMRPAPVLPLSARSEEALRALAGCVADLLGRHDPPSLVDVCAYAQTRRAGLSHRAAFIARERAPLIASLRAFADGAAAPAQGVVDERRPARVAFVCPGQGGQWAGMAIALADAEPAFAEALQRLDGAVRASAGWSLTDELEAARTPASRALENIDIVQPMLSALSLAYAELFRAYGVDADAVVGHSMGEAAAASLAGAFCAEDALRIVALRSRLMRELGGQGAMALVDAPAAEVEARLDPETVSIAAVNSPRACVISGDVAEVTKLIAAFEGEGVFARLVNVDVASHSPQMAAVAAALQRALDGLAPGKETRIFASSVLGRSARGEELGAAYWGRNLREPVRFAEATQALIEEGIGAFVELGPHPTLAPSIEQTARALGLETGVSVCGRRNGDEREAFFTALAEVWCAGGKVDWRRAAPRARHVEGFPLYRWRRRRHWAEEAELRDAEQSGTGRSSAPDEQSRGWLHQLAWRRVSPGTPAAAGRWLVLGDAPDVAAALRARGATVDEAPLAALEAMLGRGDRRNVLVSAANTVDPAYLPVRVAQAAHAGKANVWLLTRGGQTPQELVRVDVDQAALWGAARVLSEECPDLWGGVMDLRQEMAREDAEAAAAVLLGLKEEDQLAIANGQAFALRMTRSPMLGGTPMRWRPDATYLLSGGLGDVGLAVARTLAQQGARRLVLASRTGLPARTQWLSLDAGSPAGRRVTAVREIEAMGVSVLAPALDVADEQAVREFLAAYAAEAWPPIRGALHLAATLDSLLMRDMTHAQFSGPFAAKLRAAQVLDRALPDLDAFVLFSSISAYMPQTGAANYAAANAGLDALALDRRARGQHAASLAWGVWKDAGLARTQVWASNIGDLARRGVVPVEPARAAALVGWAAGREHPNVVIADVDWRVHARERAGRDEPLLRELSGQAASGSGLDLAALAPDERRKAAVRMVLDALSATLKMPLEEIALDREFGAMGLTSLMSMQLRNRLEAVTRRALPATIAFNYPTVTKLARHMAGEEEVTSPAQSKARGVQTPADLSAPLAAIASLSDEDALTALRNGGGRAP